MIYLLSFVSGFCALTLEILWVQRLEQWTGSTAAAGATVLFTFFLLMFAGASFAQKRVQKSPNPLAFYGILEAMNVVWILIFLNVNFIFYNLWLTLYQHVNTGFAILFFSLLVFGPPAFVMGAGLPYLTRIQGKISGLYALNISGAVLGSFLTGFWMLPQLGVSFTWIVGAVLTGVLALTALLLSRLSRFKLNLDKTKLTPLKESKATSKRKLLAFSSGFLFLGFEILAARMLSLVHQNSLQSFSIVLLTALLFSGLSAWAAPKVFSKVRLPLILALSAIFCLLSPILFHQLTSGLQPLYSESWSEYTWSLFQTTLLLLGPPAFLFSLWLPGLFLDCRKHPGKFQASLLQANNLGAATGALLTLFLALPLVGLWMSFFLFALIPLAFFILLSDTKSKTTSATSISLALLAGFLALQPWELPQIRDSFRGKQVRVLDQVESAEASTHVVEVGASPKKGEKIDRRIMVNNQYSIGGSASLFQERRQTQFGLQLKPQANHLLMLGMGTGISAAPALHSSAKSIRILELNKDLPPLAKEHFAPWNEGLFSDTRVEILTEDAVSFVQTDTALYDLILGELFIPWRTGTHRLYSKEHFENVQQRLNTGGIFIQWLPAYQLDEEIFLVVSRTLAEVFPELSLWRGHNHVQDPILALVATQKGGHENLLKTAKTQELKFFAGNLKHAVMSTDLEQTPMNTADNNLLAYLAPQKALELFSGKTAFFTGEALLNFQARLFQLAPPSTNPLTKNISAEKLASIRYGFFETQALFYQHTGDPLHAKEAWMRAKKYGTLKKDSVPE